MRAIVGLLVGLVFASGCGGSGGDARRACIQHDDAGATTSCVDVSSGTVACDAPRTPVDACPTAMLVGKCLDATSPGVTFTDYFYAPTTSAQAMAMCAGPGYTFVPP